jgi:glyoxylase-like metal-dependent hydrolase (beta-lactamase superfamily II)
VSASRSGRQLRVLPDSYEAGAFTGVLRQPQGLEDLAAARTAAAACPFGAIRIEFDGPDRGTQRLPPAWQGYPLELGDGVWVMSEPAVKNFCATTYFIESAVGGILIDPPRPSEEVIDWLTRHGGVHWLLLTHRDHAHHHSDFAERFPGCRRIIGASDVRLKGNAHQAATGEVEIQLDNACRPYGLDGNRLTSAEALAAGLFVFPQPGHTPGSLCLSYKGRYLFTGDHLTYSRVLSQIAAFRLQCWQDWEQQTQSVRQLVAAAEQGWLSFVWLLPGHGEWTKFGGGGTAPESAAELRRAVNWMEHQPGGRMPLPRWIVFVLSRTQTKGIPSRIVRLLGAGTENWVLPQSGWTSLPEHDVSVSTRAVRRFVTFALVLVASITVGLLSALRQ